MKMTYYGEEFNIDDEIVQRRAQRFEDTEQDLIEFVEPYLDSKYGKNIEFYVGRLGRESIEKEINLFLTTDLDLTEPAQNG